MRLLWSQRHAVLNSSLPHRSLLASAQLSAPSSFRVRAELHLLPYCIHQQACPTPIGYRHSSERRIKYRATSLKLQQLQAASTITSSFTSRTSHFHRPVTARGLHKPRAHLIYQPAAPSHLRFSTAAHFHTCTTPTTTQTTNTTIMAQRIAEESESSLSPPPEHLQVEFTAKAASNGRKRKVETTVQTVKTTKRTKKASADEVKEEEDAALDAAETPSKKRATSRKVKYEEDTDDNTQGAGGETATVVEKTAKKKITRTKKSKEPVPPLSERTMDTKLRIGAHVSVAGGVHNAIPNLLHIGANAFAMFMKNQRKWDNPAMDPEHATLFINSCKDHNIEVGDCCLPHGSYLVNLAHPDAERKKQAYDCFQNDLVRCDKLGIKLYNFHPGNANATTREEGIKLIAENLNRAHADPETGSVITVLETMASLGNTIGGTFEDIAAIISHVEQKDRVGVCLDTCHVFAAGYDLRTSETYAEVMKRFDDIIGLKYLMALHVNDSKAPLASYRDLHARIGTGYLGLRAFHNLVNDERLHGLPMVLETPVDAVDANGKKFEDKSIWAREIKMLERLVGMDVESEEFQELEKTLYEQGEGERERIGGQVERKKVKDAKPKAVRKKKGKDDDEEEVNDVKPKKAAPKRKAAAKKAESEEEDDDEE